MPNPNTPNESERNSCHCPVCLALPVIARAAGCVAVPPLTKAAACLKETATQCADREIAEILAARAESNAESDRLRTFLKDCRCPCCDARDRLRAISYDRAERSSAEIHCETSDRRDHHPDTIREIVVACVVDCLAATYPRQRREWFRETIDKAIRAAAEVCRPNTGSGPACDD